MTARTRSVPIADFEAFYRSGEDPYRMNTRWYEQRKRDVTVAALPREHYSFALELACGEGALTRLLAPRADRLRATEGSPTALLRAKEAFVDDDAVEIVEHVLPADCPAGPYDLVVFAEVGYFLDDDDLRSTRDSMVSELEPGGELVAVHWRHPSPDYPLDGGRVHALLGEAPALTRLVHHDDEDFVLDVWRAPDAAARRAGITT